MKIKHADLTPAAVTGKSPLAIFGAYFGGRDDMDGDKAWYGCIDAPDAILLGGCVAVDTGGHAYGLGYECTTPRTKLRERLTA